MSILIVGSVALDSIKTPVAENLRLLGGSASYGAVAASFFSPVKMVGVVGEDFPKKFINFYKKHNIDIEGLQIQKGKTFHWVGEYEINMNNRRTISTELGVFENFNPILPPSYKDSSYVVLANISPSLQHNVLDQIKKPKFVAADTMDLWLNIALEELLRLLKRIDLFVLNDSEAKLLTKEDNIIKAIKGIHKLGPKYVIVKKGEHGSILSSNNGLFIAPAYPLERVIDPTGAGDSFLGALMGYLASKNGNPINHIRKAIIYGSVVASFCCEGFGLSKLIKINRQLIDERFDRLKKMCLF
ncbi:MAG TPA: PfkB family carbohydrate kinase [Verrucomicrobiota bacterium]|nr:PfkB family carbohydrate kinase [Verrucomicrobiota bacterium]